MGGMSRVEDVAGRTIVVVGASSGFGRGAAERLGELGANVVVASRRAGVLEDVAARVAAAGGRSLAVALDASDPLAASRLVDEAVDRFERIDAWVNNAGIAAIGRFWDIPIADHARIVDVNLKGVIFGAHAALRHFIARGEGTLINTGSVESEVPLAYQATYAATKAGVLSLGRSLNEELRLAGYADRIRVGTIMPWAVDTPFWTHTGNYTGRTPRMAAMDDPQLVVDAIVRACVDPKEEQPVGGKARGAKLSHQLFPDLAEHLSADLSDSESRKGMPAPDTSGAIHEPMSAGTTVEGGARERIERENSVRREGVDRAR